MHTYFDSETLRQSAASLFKKSLDLFDSQNIPDKSLSYIKKLQNFDLSFYEPIFYQNEFQFLIDRPQDFIKHSIFHELTWEIETTELLKQILQEGFICLDIGAHIGTHTLKMSKLVGPRGQVIGFEPTPKLFQELCYNLALNQINNTQALPVALGHQMQDVRVVELHTLNEGMNMTIENVIYISEANKKTFESYTLDIVPCLTLDSLQFEKIDFIKIDVEGSELSVLYGAQKTLHKLKPILFIELHGQETYFQSLLAITSFLEPMGYTASHLGSRHYIFK